MFDPWKKFLRNLRKISCFSTRRQSTEDDRAAIYIPNRQQETFGSAVSERSAPRQEFGNTTGETLADTAPESVGWSSLTLSSLADISCRPYRNVPHLLLIMGSPFVVQALPTTRGANPKRSGQVRIDRTWNPSKKERNFSKNMRQTNNKRAHPE